MSFTIKTAEKKKLKLKICLQGASGSGKTYSALQLAYGITGDWKKVYVIDTENESATYYSDQGPWKHVNFTPPYHPNRYIEAIDACMADGAEVIVIDSLTHEWDGRGGCLELHQSEVDKQKYGNSFTAWKNITPLHNAFIDHLRISPVHIIGCTRTKQEYSLEKNEKGQAVPKKIGLKGVQRDGIDYEFGLVFELDMDHMAFSGKDRTGLFADKPKHMITPDTGRKLLDWANSGKEEVPIIELYEATPEHKNTLMKIAKMQGINDLETYKKLSEKCMGIPMTEISSEITAHLSGN